ncbi:hypothetical protein [uncultured Butyricimonas sp.]|nr:hypothetical protein [uncultured Butyricimonas sp.]
MLFALAAIPAIIMLLWNWLIPSIIGWSAISYWQALGLFILSRLFFGGFGRHGFGHHGFGMPHGEHPHLFREKFKNMSPEERKDFIRQRFEEHHELFNDRFFGKKEQTGGQEQV